MLNLGLEKNPLQLSIEKDEAVLKNIRALEESMEVRNFVDTHTGKLKEYKVLAEAGEMLKRIRVNYHFFYKLWKKYGDAKFNVSESELSKLKDTHGFSNIQKELRHGLSTLTLKEFVHALGEKYMDGKKATREAILNCTKEDIQFMRTTLALCALLKRSISQGRTKLNKPLTYPDGTQVYAPERNNKSKTSGSEYQRHQVDIPYKPKATIGY